MEKPNRMSKDDDKNDPLWREIIKGIKPLKRDHAPLPRQKRIRLEKTLPPRERPLPYRPPATGIDHRTENKLQRGNMRIEARLDLHGMTQDRAHQTLRQFITQCVHNHKRCVLVITGKGKAEAADSNDGAASKGGVLRQAVPRWLEEPGLAGHILKISPAQPRHGGDGAFYILLRRQRDKA